MVRTEPIIGVADVKKSALWYQQLLGCRATHGGQVFEILLDEDGTVLLCLHRWGDHDHPTLKSANKHSNNGLILYFVVDDITRVLKNAQKHNLPLAKDILVNPNSGRHEFSLLDPDGYYISICSNEPIA